MDVTSTAVLAIQTVLAIQKIQKAVWILDFDGFSIFGLVPRRSVFGIRKRAAWILDLGIWIFHDFSRALGFCKGKLAGHADLGRRMIDSFRWRMDWLLVMCCKRFGRCRSRLFSGRPHHIIDACRPDFLPSSLLLAPVVYFFFVKLSKDVNAWFKKSHFWNTLNLIGAWIWMSNATMWWKFCRGRRPSSRSSKLPALDAKRPGVWTPFSGRFLIGSEMFAAHFWCQGHSERSVSSISHLAMSFWIILAETKHRYPAIAAMLYSFAHADRCFGHSASGQDQNERPGETLLPVERRWC